MSTSQIASAASHQERENDLPLTGGIVVGVDGSPESIAALNTGAAMARRRKLALHSVLAIPEFPQYHMTQRGEMSDQALDSLRTTLKDSELAVVMRAIGSAEEGWTHEVIIGSAASRLAEIGKDRGAELIIVGRHAHGVTDAIFGGETTLHLMRRALTPVLALDTEVPSPRIAVAAIDFSPSSITAAKELRRLLVSPATLYLAYVEPPAEILPAGFSLPPDDHYSGGIAARFRGIIEDLGPHREILVEPCVLTGRPVPCLLEYAERVGAEIMSAGSHGHNRIERILLGSVSTSLVKDARRGVLIAPSEEN